MSLRLRAFVIAIAFGLSSTLAAQTAPPAAPSFPLQLITGEGEGPALFVDAGGTTAGVGYISAGVPIEVLEPPANDRVLVRIRGGMRVRAKMVATRLAAVVQRRGRIRGTPVYVGPGSRVRVLGFEADGRTRVSASVQIGSRTVTFEGTYPTVGLGATRPEVTPDLMAPGEVQVLHATTPVPLYDAPNGTVVETLPIGDHICRLVQTQDGFHSVIVGDGDGPYLAGFVQGELMGLLRVASPPTAPAVGAFPRRLRSDAELPLVHLAAGTRVTFEGETIALLDRPGYARVIERHAETNEADVFVAVDDDLAVRGMVEMAALGEAVR